mgnify:CR=1 FL=1
MEFNKHYCRLFTEFDIPDDDVVEFYEIVTSTVPAKVVTAYLAETDKVSVQVTQYDTDTGGFMYEIVLAESVEETEGDQIMAELSQSFDFQFDFETSTEA